MQGPHSRQQLQSRVVRTGPTAEGAGEQKGNGQSDRGQVAPRLHADQLREGGNGRDRPDSVPALPSS